MHQDVGKLVEEIDETSKVSEQSNDNVQSVAASTQEQDTAMEEVAAASIHLAKMAIDLQGTVAAFKYYVYIPNTSKSLNKSFEGVLNDKLFEFIYVYVEEK